MMVSMDLLHNEFDWLSISNAVALYAAHRFPMSLLSTPFNGRQRGRWKFPLRAII